MFFRSIVTTLVLATGVAGCTVPEPDAPQDRQSLYLAAVKASAVPDPDAPAKLWPIEGKKATVVSWSGPYYKPGKTVLDFGALWVTPVPQVQEICQKAPADAKQARLEELLGLPPGGGKDRSFVVMTVSTADMFRPCPDTRVDQPSCPMDMPKAPPPGVSQEQWQKDLDFLLAQMIGSYRTEGGYPFTRLGYTYDWNPDAASPVGASEYVIRQGAEVEVLQVIPNEDYCAAPSG